MRSFIIATALSATLSLATPVTSTPLAPLSSEGEHIEDAYIVVLKKDITPDQMSLHLLDVEQTHALDVS
jgi:hypothetical protein